MHLTGPCVEKSHRPWPQLRTLWRKAVFRQMILGRMEREVRERRAIAEELEVQRLCLSYSEALASQDTRSAWLAILSRTSDGVSRNDLQSCVARGVPKDMRGDVWQLMASSLQPPSGKQLPLSYDTPYVEMIKGLTSQQHSILIDLGRTFPQHPYFTRTLGPGQLSLFNLLKAYSRLDGEVGYCQGLSFIAGIILLHTDEETAYTLLKHLMFLCGVRRQFMEELDGLQVCVSLLPWLLHPIGRKNLSHNSNYFISQQSTI